MTSSGFYEQDELSTLGFAHLGTGVSLSRKASIYGAGRISIGDHSRIDDFCILSAGEGGIAIGRHVHVAAMSILTGAGHIELEDYCGLSSRVSIYSSSDDYSGDYMTNPAVPAEFTNVASAPVRIGSHAIVGAGTVILPGTELGRGTAVGALSLVNRSLPADTICAGVPARPVRERAKGVYEQERRWRERGA